MREAYKRKELDDSSINVLLASLSDNIYKQYDAAVKKCCSIFEGDIKFILRFFTKKFNNDAQYGTLN